MLGLSGNCVPGPSTQPSSGTFIGWNDELTSVSFAIESHVSLYDCQSLSLPYTSSHSSNRCTFYHVSYHNAVEDASHPPRPTHIAHRCETPDLFSGLQLRASWDGWWWFLFSWIPCCRLRMCACLCVFWGGLCILAHLPLLLCKPVN